MLNRDVGACHQSLFRTRNTDTLVSYIRPMTDDHHPTVTIGIPVFNGENFLAAALESVLAQTYGDFEMVICDNASTDRTREICKRFQEQDDRIRYYANDANLGAAANFNRVFELARGELFKWHAHDDFIAPRFLEACVDALESNPEAVLACPQTVFLDRDFKSVVKAIDPSARTGSAKVFERFVDLLYDTDRHYVFGLIRSSVLKSTQLIGNYIDSDGNLIIELSLRGPFVDVPELLLFLREHRERSIYAHAHYQKREVWFDTSKEGKRNFPAWRAIAEYHKSLTRVPLGIADKSMSYLLLMNWIVRHRWRVLAGQVKYNLMSLIVQRKQG